jgi:hypothetical protein
MCRVLHIGCYIVVLIIDHCNISSFTRSLSAVRHKVQGRPPSRVENAPKSWLGEMSAMRTISYEQSESYNCRDSKSKD